MLLNNKEVFENYQKKTIMEKLLMKLFCRHLWGLRPIWYFPSNKSHYGGRFCLKCLKHKNWQEEEKQND